MLDIFECAYLFAFIFLMFCISFYIVCNGVRELAESKRIKRNNEDNKTYNRLEKIIIEKCLTCPKFHSETIFKEMNELKRLENEINKRKE